MSEIKNDPVNRRIEGCYIENTIKYICRWKKKNDLKDLKKARMYLNWLIDHEEKKHPHMAPPYTYPASGEYCCCESKMRESSDPEPNRPKDADWIARQILADLAGMSVNDTTNTLTTKIIFGNDKKPQKQFHC